MGTPEPFTMQASLEGSPPSVLIARIAAELADSAIPCACPHPASVDRLSLPSRMLSCHECHDGVSDHPDSTPGPCAACGAAGGCTWTVWLDEPTRVLVVARMCAGCGTGGSVPLCPN